MLGKTGLTLTVFVSSLTVFSCSFSEASGGGEPLTAKFIVESSAVVREISGANAAETQAAVDAFRADLGDPVNGAAVGSQGMGRREINWDAVPDADSAPGRFPGDFFNAVSPRGVVFSFEDRTSFQVSADAANGPAAPVEFGNLNATYPTAFSTFSSERLFTTLGSRVLDINFVIPGSLEPAGVRGFGAVFTDVDLPGTSSIEYFDSTGNLLFARSVLPKPDGVDNESLSFLGASFPEEEPLVARVRITSGSVPVGQNDMTQGGANDVVVLDDFIYGEPLPLAAFSIDDVTVAESDTGQTDAVFNLLLSTPHMRDVSVEYVTINGSAQSPEDFGEIRAVATIPAGVTDTNISVDVFGDEIFEGDEFFRVFLFNPSADAVVEDPFGVGTIIEDDAPVSNLLSGFVYLDTNGNLARDPEDTGIADVIVEMTGLADLSDPVRRVTRTNLEGKYEFSGLRPGVYSLNQTQPIGYSNGLQMVGTPFGGAPSGINRIENIVIPVGVAVGEDYDFSEFSGIRTIREAVGSDPSALQATVDAFRADLGDPVNGAAVGSQGAGRRQINWDAVPDGDSASGRFPRDFFNSISPRGTVFSFNPRTSFQVSADSVNPTATDIEFGNVNATYPTAFNTFSPERLFTALTSHVVDVRFFVPGTGDPAVVSGFGAAFTDVDTANVSKVEYFDEFDTLLFERNILSQPGNASLSFMGTTFLQESRLVHRVRITAGSAALGPNDVTQGGANDIVVLDDFIYGEPQPLQVELTKSSTLLIDNDGDGRVDPGDTIRYRLTATNPFPDAVPDSEGDEIIDDLSPNLTIKEARLARGNGQVEVSPFLNIVTWNGFIPAKDTVVIEIDAQVRLDCTAQILGNQAFFTLAAKEGESTPTLIVSDNPDTPEVGDPTQFAVDPAIDLSIAKTQIPGNGLIAGAIPGDIVRYDVTVRNNGTLSATGAVLSDAFPSELSDIDWICVASGGATCMSETGSGDLNETVDLPIGSSLVFTVTATISAGASGNLVNTAQIQPSTDTNDADPSNNSATSVVTLNPIADLAVTLSASPDALVEGEDFAISIEVANEGPSDASGASLIVLLPPGASFVSADSGCVETSGVVTCTINTLPAGESSTLTIDAIAQQAGVLTLIAQVGGRTTDLRSDNNASAIGVFVGGLDATATPTSAAPGPSPTPTRTFHPADINEDLEINDLDILELLRAWRIDLGG